MTKAKQSRLLLLSLAALVLCASASDSSSNNEHTGVDIIREFATTAQERMCPDGGTADDDSSTCNEFEFEQNPHKIVSCREIKHSGMSKNLTFSCSCKYLKPRRHNCEPDIKLDFEPVHNECLFVNVGMAIKGYNQLFRQWTNKETCFNMCLRTTIQNGAQFDCRSFEHWHRDCSETSTTTPIASLLALNSSAESQPGIAISSDNASSQGLVASRPCASFSINDDDHEQTMRERRQRSSGKFSYCVLSNQTIKSAGVLFAPNNKVTYYELLCNRPGTQQPNRKSRPPQSIPSQIKTKSPQVVSPIATARMPTSPESFKPPTPRTISRANGTWSSGDSVTTMPPSRRCPFDPCSNGGSCLLIDRDRFTCTCKEFFYGIYCDQHIVQKKCLKNHMELLINHRELANQLEISTTDLFINDKFVSMGHSFCQLKALNSTFSRFKVPFQKCATLQTNTQFENIFTVKLMSQKELGGLLSRLNQPSAEDNSSYSHQQNEAPDRHLLLSFECRFDKQQQQNTTEIIIPAQSGHFPNSFNEKVVKSTSPCILDLLNIRLSVFGDRFYHKELSSPQLSMSSRAIASLHRRLYVQMYVERSPEHSEDFAKLQDKLKFIHLTVRRCYLTRTQNEKTNVVQVLIDQGCAKKGADFDPFADSSNFIHFWFDFSPKAKSDKPDTVYLHCFPELCTDIHPPKSSSKEDYQFFSSLKLCEKVKQDCNANDHKSSPTAASTFTTSPAATSTPVLEMYKPMKTSVSSDYESPQLPPPPSYEYVNRRPILLPHRSKGKYRGGFGYGGGDDYMDESDLSRFQPQHVEEERIFSARSVRSMSHGGCNNKFTYGPIYLEDMHSFDQQFGLDFEGDRLNSNFFRDNSAVRSYFGRNTMGFISVVVFLTIYLC